MRRTVLSAMVLSCTVLVAGCGNDPEPVAEPPAEVTEQPAEPPAVETPTPTPEVTPVQLAGDAATNKACKLATAEEVEQVTGYKVQVVEGLPVGYRGDIQCIWRLEAVDYGGPALTVAWDRKDTDAAAKIGLYRQLIEAKERTELPGFGDVAIQDGSTIDLIDGKHWLFMTLRLRQIATPEDQRMNRELLQLMFPRTRPAKAG